MKPRLYVPRLTALLLAVALPVSAPAFVVNISSAGGTAVYLRVGDGDAGTFQNNNLTSSTGKTLVSLTVPAATLGSGVNLPMTSNATRAGSSYENFAFCNVPAEVYIGGFYRRSGSTTRVATLVATAPANLTTAGGTTIPSSQISWTSSGIGDTGAQPVPAGSFNGTGAQQTLASFNVNTWRESCLRFTYGNDVFPAAGVYNGTVTFTLITP
ncbi:hypothetical protein [Montanilutibacter psychrotolerans]|uniref:DUF4402 domain-containing protein n=1 Tax=Montanilutibacter psychrotolerans TaxID=1327343 RepID=A0A3M8T0B3_9GAMM|nr:hypothetical protein [Lysobacter psychrotolerans]RNF86395.1 hypothetical protein EER27_02970 [Lysobacter psychrotolerans]